MKMCMYFCTYVCIYLYEFIMNCIFYSHKKKRQRLKKARMLEGKQHVDSDDPLEYFIASTNIRYCYYRLLKLLFLLFIIFYYNFISLGYKNYIHLSYIIKLILFLKKYFKMQLIIYIEQNNSEQEESLNNIAYIR